MAVKQKKEKPAIVVRYRPTRKAIRVSSRYVPIFLPVERQYNLMLETITQQMKGVIVRSINLMRPGRPSSVWQFVINSEEAQPIHDMEVVLEKEGQITKLIMEAKGAPDKRARQDDLSVLFTYDWELLTDLGDFDLKATGEPDGPTSGLRFYEYTETANALLNDVVAGYTRLAFQERKKSQPEPGLLEELEINKKLALTLLRQPQSFFSIDRLQEVIEDYTPIVRSLFEHNSASSLAAS